MPECAHWGAWGAQGAILWPERYPTATAPRASTTVLARRFRADPHEVGRIEGLGLDSLELAEHVDQGQQIEVSAGHEPEDVAPVSSSTRASTSRSAPVSSSTRASVARDARRSHRSVEGDDQSNVCVCDRHTAGKPPI